MQAANSNLVQTMISPDKIDVLLHQGADYLNAPGVDAASIGARIAHELSSLTEESALEH